MKSICTCIAGIARVLDVKIPSTTTSKPSAKKIAILSRFLCLLIVLIAAMLEFSYLWNVGYWFSEFVATYIPYADMSLSCCILFLHVEDDR